MRSIRHIENPINAVCIDFRDERESRKRLIQSWYHVEKNIQQSSLILISYFLSFSGGLSEDEVSKNDVLIDIGREILMMIGKVLDAYTEASSMQQGHTLNATFANVLHKQVTALQLDIIRKSFWAMLKYLMRDQWTIVLEESWVRFFNAFSNFLILDDKQDDVATIDCTSTVNCSFMSNIQTSSFVSNTKEYQPKENSCGASDSSDLSMNNEILGILPTVESLSSRRGGCYSIEHDVESIPYRPLSTCIPMPRDIDNIDDLHSISSTPLKSDSDEDREDDESRAALKDQQTPQLDFFHVVRLAGRASLTGESFQTSIAPRDSFRGKPYPEESIRRPSFTSPSPRSLEKFDSRRNWSMASSLIAQSKFSYFSTFVPRLATQRLANSCLPDRQASRDFVAYRRELAILLVDISGFTRLCDRFGGLGQDGIDALTLHINRIFKVILNHIDSWGGDVIKFDGDALIVVWESQGPGQLADALRTALECGQELENKHGNFTVEVPDLMRLALADQICKHFASASSGLQMPSRKVGVSDSTLHDGGSTQDLQTMEVRRVLRDAPGFSCLNDNEVSMLARACDLGMYHDGEIILQEGKEGHTMYVIQSGEVLVGLSTEVDSGSSGNSSFGKRSDLRVAEFATCREGDAIGEIALLTGQPHTATAVARGNCTVVRISARALQPVLSSNDRLLGNLLEMMRQHLEARPRGASTSGTVTLRLHQGLACGQSLLAHIGGERLLEPYDIGSRREFLVMGPSVLRAGEALDDAAVGELVVSGDTWPMLEDKYEGSVTRNGHYKVSLSAMKGTGLMPRTQLSPPAEPNYSLWTQLKHYCHEGARDLQDVADYAADLRRLTIVFVKLHLDLGLASLDVAQAAHNALLAMQSVVYARRGTLQKMLQDDKGLVAIWVFGMPPFSPHENDATRAVLASIDFLQGLADQGGLRAGVGIATGPAYSGFVGTASRREMCAMGATVNMAARLMGKAGEGILVDQATRDRSVLMVEYILREPLLVKGRDEPITVFEPAGRRQERHVLDDALSVVRRELQVTSLPEQLMAYFARMLIEGNQGKDTDPRLMTSGKSGWYDRGKLSELSENFIRNICENLLENNHIIKQGDVVEVSEKTSGFDELVDGLTASQALSRGNLEILRPCPPCHTQMLAKVACLLSIPPLGIVSLGLVKYVYCASFPSFAPLFEKGLSQLTHFGLLRPANADEVAAQLLSPIGHHKVNRCPILSSNEEDKEHPDSRNYYGSGASGPSRGQGYLWDWTTGNLRCDVYSELLGYSTHERNDGPNRKGSNHCRRGVLRNLECCSSSAISNAGPTPSADILSSAFLDFLQGKKERPVYVIPIAGLAQSLSSGLLQAYQATWYRHAAEYLEKILCPPTAASHLLLAHFWSGTVQSYGELHSAAEQVMLLIRHLKCSAQLAVDCNAYAVALDFMQRACTLLDRLPDSYQRQGTSNNRLNRKTELLLEMAPLTLLIYGPGSKEAVAAYQGLSRLLLPSDLESEFDDVSVQVLAGACANLSGGGLVHQAMQTASKILSRARQPSQLIVGWALFVPALFHAGDYDGVIDLCRRLRPNIASEDTEPGTNLGPLRLVNGVELILVAYSFLPAALASKGNSTHASAAEEVLDLMEACVHAPTKCHMLGYFCRDYLRIIGDGDRAACLVVRLEAIAENLDLAHGRELLISARRWILVEKELRGMAGTFGHSLHASWGNDDSLFSCRQNSSAHSWSGFRKNPCSLEGFPRVSSEPARVGGGMSCLNLIETSKSVSSL